MKLVAKAILYVALFLVAIMSLKRVRTESSAASVHDQRIASELAADGDGRASAPGPSPSATATATAAATNPAAAATTLAGTNAVTEGAATNQDAALPAGSSAGRAPSGKAGQSGLGLWIAVFVVTLFGLAGLIGWDMTQWFAQRANRALGVDAEAPKEKAPEYDAAEEEWAKGNHLDAITMMREYLARNPNEQYVALRIAEIYEKDLGNYLVAAMEYEEVLKQKLPREKWGWTALRLSNLYSGRLNQPDNAIATLERVIKEYPETAAAKKARERLGVPEPTDVPVGEMDVNTITPAEPEPGDLSLPTGFRRKK